MKKLKVTAAFAEDLEGVIEKFDLEDGFKEADFSGMYSSDIIEPLFEVVEEESPKLHDGLNLAMKTSAVIFYAIRYGIEIEEPKTFVAYMNFRESAFSDDQKIFFGAGYHTTKAFRATPFGEENKHDMERLEKLEKQGWTRMEFKDED